MGAPLSELVIETVIRDGLGDLRANPAKLDDIFSKFNQTFFSTQYGQSKIEQIKTFIQNKQVRIVQAWAQVPMSVPCISVQLESATEDESIQQFSDDYEDVDTAITPTIYVNNIQPGTYDSVSGKLTIANPNVVDLSVICPGMIFVDAAGTKFPLLSGSSNLAGNKFINIGPAQEPNLSNVCRIESSLDKQRTERRMIRLREGISLGVHSSNDIHLTKFIYYILVYILKSRTDMLINRGIHLDWGQGSIYNREDQFQGENIFSRFLKVNCITEFDWNQKQANLVDCFDLTLKAPAPNPNSTGTVILTKTGEEP